ncbi:leucine-rich repeat-containing protein 40 [Episyrphus balteatus]|uniref:leucine-rich repeat-containing protein 40 n=1 Tax=Episyrphus balteatus TaxID=286459 RepID=UPI002486B4EB|nr:leucine-rich repeat-containing protein 40 [Episyrphus balteatus]
MASRASRRPNLRNLNPVFHKREKSEDNSELSHGMIKQARKSGVLNLSGRGLATVPDKVWNLHEPEKEVEVTLDTLMEREEDAWWNQRALTNLDLSSNTLTSISPNIQNLHALTVLSLYDNALTSIPKEIGQLEKLTRVNLSRNKLKELPAEFFRIRDLKHLTLAYNCFEELNPDVSDLHMLEVLDVSNNNLKSLPGGIGFLVRLTQLLCSYNHLKELPDDLVNMRSLQKLDLMHNDLESLPMDIGSLRKLQCLYAQHNDIRLLPDFDGCVELQELHIANNFIKEVPGDLCSKLPHLKILDLRDNKIEKLPDEIALLQSLIRLDLSNNSINSLPNSLHTLAHLVSLQVEGNPIKSIRRDILQCGTGRILKTLRDRSQLDASTMPEVKDSALVGEENSIFPDKFKIRKTRSLNVAMQNISTIPIKVFQDAQEEAANIVDLSKNRIEDVPEGLEKLVDCATEIILSQNLISSIPVFMTQFSRLSRLDVSCNNLSDLPNEFGGLAMLRELNIANNKFKHFPSCIYELQGLEILLARENQIEKIDASNSGLGALKRLATLDLRNNNIEHVPPILGNLKNITCLDIIGNRFRQPRHQVLEKGTDAVMSYLRDRIPN